MATEKLDHLSLPIKTGFSEKFLLGIAHPSRIHRARQNALNIKPTIFHSNRTTGWGKIDRESPLRSFNSGTDVLTGRSGRNIDNHTGVNPQRTIRIINQDINSAIPPFRGL